MVPDIALIENLKKGVFALAVERMKVVGFHHSCMLMIEAIPESALESIFITGSRIHRREYSSNPSIKKEKRLRVRCLQKLDKLKERDKLYTLAIHRILDASSSHVAKDGGIELLFYPATSCFIVADGLGQVGNDLMVLYIAHLCHFLTHPLSSDLLSFAGSEVQAKWKELMIYEQSIAC